MAQFNSYCLFQLVSHSYVLLESQKAFHDGHFGFYKLVDNFGVLPRPIVDSIKSNNPKSSMPMAFYILFVVKMLAEQQNDVCCLIYPSGNSYWMVGFIQLIEFQYNFLTKKTVIVLQQVVLPVCNFNQSNKYITPGRCHLMYVFSRLFCLASLRGDTKINLVLFLCQVRLEYAYKTFYINGRMYYAGGEVMLLLHSVIS